MFRNEALQTGLGKTANDLLDLITQHRGSEASPLVSERSRLQSVTDSATGRRLTNEKIPVITARNTRAHTEDFCRGPGEVWCLFSDYMGHSIVRNIFKYLKFMSVSVFYF